MEVYGAQFFGGAAEKEVFVDEDDIVSASSGLQSFSTLFPDPSTCSLATLLNKHLNKGKYTTSSDEDKNESLYDPNMVWESELNPTTLPTPLHRTSSFSPFTLGTLSIIYFTGRSIDPQTTSLRFNVGFNYPSFYSPRVTLLGNSIITHHKTPEGDTVVTKQVDELDVPLQQSLVEQLPPKFWDLYHIQMTPSSEVKDRVKVSGFLTPYTVYQEREILVLHTKIWDTTGRSGRLATAVPSDMFSCTLKTVGPLAEEYVASSGVEVGINKDVETGGNYITWELDVPSVGVTSMSGMKVGDVDVEDDVKEATTMKVRGARRYASVRYDGEPQDDGIKDVRRRLFEGIVKDGGEKVKMGEDGRPRFFFRYKTAKTCWVEGGMGMVVWEWRARGFRGHEVCVELEMEE